MLVFVPVPKTKHLPGQHDQKRHGGNRLSGLDLDYFLRSRGASPNAAISIVRDWSNREIANKSAPDLETALALIETKLPSGTRPKIEYQDITTLRNVPIVLSNDTRLTFDMHNGINLILESVVNDTNYSEGYENLAGEHIKFMEGLAPLLGYRRIDVRNNCGPADYFAENGYFVNPSTLPRGDFYNDVSHPWLNYSSARLKEFCRYSFIKYLYTEFIDSDIFDNDSNNTPQGTDASNAQKMQKNLVNEYLTGHNSGLDAYFKNGVGGNKIWEEPDKVFDDLQKTLGTKGFFPVKDLLNARDSFGAGFLIYGLLHPTVVYTKGV